MHGFDLVAEIITVQALPDPPRRQAITNIGRLVAPGGTLLVIAAVHNDDAPPSTLPPWPLQRAEIEAFAAGGLTQVRIKIVATLGDPAERRWRAEFYRPLKMRVLSDQLTSRYFGAPLIHVSSAAKYEEPKADVGVGDVAGEGRSDDAQIGLGAPSQTAIRGGGGCRSPSPSVRVVTGPDQKPARSGVSHMSLPNGHLNPLEDRPADVGWSSCWGRLA
jgi:hypothetical protein